MCTQKIDHSDLSSGLAGESVRHKDSAMACLLQVSSRRARQGIIVVQTAFGGSGCRANQPRLRSCLPLLHGAVQGR